MFLFFIFLKERQMQIHIYEYNLYEKVPSGMGQNHWEGRDSAVNFAAIVCGFKSEACQIERCNFSREWAA